MDNLNFTWQDIQTAFSVFVAVFLLVRLDKKLDRMTTTMAKICTILKLGDNDD